MKNQKTAFVLGGGSIKGAYQIGVMHGLIQKGIAPDIITGISVGSLNGLLYAHYLGIARNPAQAINACIRFWKRYVTKPSDIISRKSWLRIIREILTGKFTGLLKTGKLEQLVEKEINLYYVDHARVKLKVGAVNMNSGQIEYKGSGHSLIKKFTLASSRIPIMMPPSVIKGNEYFDGGLIDNAAIGQAINMGATDIYVLANHPETVSTGFNESKSLMAMVDRIMEITVNNTLNNDIMEAQLINRLVKHRAAPGKRHVNITVLRPAKSIGIDIENFTAADITNMIMSGSASVQKI